MSNSFFLKFFFVFLLCCQVFATTSPKTLQFPLDHGKHAEAEREWWGFFGHLFDAHHHVYGFSLTFLRQAVPPQLSSSQWTTQDIYVSHMTITDSEQEQFYFQEKINRTSFNYAGASENQLWVWNRGWQAIMNKNGAIDLQAQTNKIGFVLHLKPTKPLLLFGNNGFLSSNQVYYNAFPELQGEGTLRIGNKEYSIATISASAEHAFQIQKNMDAFWDKFIIELNNGDTIFLYILGAKNSIFTDPESFCVINQSDGKSIMLKLADFQLTYLDSWYSQNSKTYYPLGWILTIPAYHYRLTIKPTMQNQEVTTLNRVYWGGQSIVTGEKDTLSLSGHAYVELSKQKSRNYFLK